MTKILIDREACIGCGSCTAVAQEIFEMDENFKAKLKKKEDFTEEEIKLAQEAVDMCPVKAIKIIE